MGVAEGSERHRWLGRVFFSRRRSARPSRSSPPDARPRSSARTLANCSGPATLLACVAVLGDESVVAGEVDQGLGAPRLPLGPNEVHRLEERVVPSRTAYVALVARLPLGDERDPLGRYRRVGRGCGGVG